MLSWELEGSETSEAGPWHLLDRRIRHTGLLAGLVDTPPGGPREEDDSPGGQAGPLFAGWTPPSCTGSGPRPAGLPEAMVEMAESFARARTETGAGESSAGPHPGAWADRPSPHHRSLTLPCAAGAAGGRGDAGPQAAGAAGGAQGSGGLVGVGGGKGAAEDGGGEATRRFRFLRLRQLENDVDPEDSDEELAGGGDGGGAGAQGPAAGWCPRSRCMWVQGLEVYGALYVRAGLPGHFVGQDWI